MAGVIHFYDMRLLPGSVSSHTHTAVAAIHNTKRSPHQRKYNVKESGAYLKLSDFKMNQEERVENGKKSEFWSSFLESINFFKLVVC